MAKNKSRLGRGLSSLLSVSSPEAVTEADHAPVAQIPNPPAASTAAPPTEGELFHVELSKVVANPQQPRRTFDDAALRSLAESLKNAGLIQPIVVRPTPTGYELVAGERRWRAAQLAGLTRLPALLRRIDATEQAELALIENIHRADLNPLERALAYRNLLELLGHTQEELSIRLGEDRSTIANHLRLLDLCEPIRQLVVDGQLSLGHAKLLAGVHDLLQQQQWGERAVAQQLSVRNLEQLIRAGKTEKTTPPPTIPSAYIADLEKRLSGDLQMRVQVKQAGKKGRGRMVIHYGSLDQFDELLAKLGVNAND